MILQFRVIDLQRRVSPPKSAKEYDFTIATLQDNSPGRRCTTQYEYMLSDDDAQAGLEQDSEIFLEVHRQQDRKGTISIRGRIAWEIGAIEYHPKTSDGAVGPLRSVA